MITDEMRSQMQAINANLNHTRVKKPGARYFRFDRKKGKTVEVKRPNAIVGHSMFPYPSNVLPTVDLNDPEAVAAAVAQCRQKGVNPEFDSEGRFIVTSTKQHGKLAEAMEMKTGRDGYGHKDEHGKFQNSGRRRADEVKEGRRKVRRAINELEQMPEDSPAGAVSAMLDEYDIRPTEENTG